MRPMATPKPGEIRCPTCHRSTPPATFCTQCGSAIPADARIRPRGLDRDELQERIRARRSGGDPYRRGGALGDEGSGYERFEPEPTDRAAVRSRAEEEPRRDLLSDTPRPHSRGAAAAGAGASQPLHAIPGDTAPRPDLTRDREDWTRPVEEPVAAAAAPHLAPVDDYPRTDADEPYADGYADYDEPRYEGDYEEWEEEPHDRRSAGAGALLILGFLALGVLALLGGAVLAGVFGGDPQTGAIPSPSSSVSSEPAPTSTVAESVAPTETAAPPSSGPPAASGGPIVFPDGFTAEVQPCLPGSPDVDGCGSNGATNSGTVEIWVGFENGNQNDVISAQVVPEGGTPEGTGTMDLARLGCQGSCNGWTYFPFGGLSPGTYQVLVTRNGEPAGETSFVVS